MNYVSTAKKEEDQERRPWERAQTQELQCCNSWPNLIKRIRDDVCPLERCPSFEITIILLK